MVNKSMVKSTNDNKSTGVSVVKKKTVNASNENKVDDMDKLKISSDKINKSNSKSDNSKKPLKSGRKFKDDKFVEERKIILDKLFNILGVSEDNMSLDIKALESDDVKKQEIINLSDDVKKYFSYSNWTFYRIDNKDILKYPHVGLTKSILRAMGYKMEGVYVFDRKTRQMLKNKVDIIKI